ncbi:MAG: DUF6291 domain-containing protein [Bacillota bacterium]|jgi:hypothetical protein
MSNKQSFILYHEYLQHFAAFSDAEVGQLMRAIFNYEIEQLDPQFSGALGMAFSFIRVDLDNNRRKYQQKCEAMRKNAQKRWAVVQKHADDADNDLDYENQHDSESVNKNDRQRSARGGAAAYPLPQKQIEEFTAATDLQEALLEFLAWRRQMQKPLNNYGVYCLLKELRELATEKEEQLVLVQQALAHGWLGFYPKKAEAGAQKGGAQSKNKSEYEAVYDKLLKP